MRRRPAGVGVCPRRQCLRGEKPGRRHPKLASSGVPSKERARERLLVPGTAIGDAANLYTQQRRFNRAIEFPILNRKQLAR